MTAEEIANLLGEHKDIVALHYDLIKLEKSVKTVRELIDKIYKK